MKSFTCWTAAAIAVVTTTGRADTLAPPAPTTPSECWAALTAQGVRVADWPVRPVHLDATHTCSVSAGVRLLRTRARIRYSKMPQVGCAFATRLARFEDIVQEEARRYLKAPVVRIQQLGTYSCRKMAAYPDLVSEHSYANAIDVAAFTLRDGRTVDVEKHFVKGGKATADARALFLRALARRLYDDQVFSVVLTPNYDRHHRNHFHLDGASYTVDGT